MSVSILGIGSGIDLSGLLEDLMKAQRAPTENRLDKREANIHARMTGYNTVKGALNDLQTTLRDLRSFREGRTTEVSNTSVLTASADRNVTPGTVYNVNVKQLATSHGLQSSNFEGDKINKTGNHGMGTGTLSIEFAGKKTDINITNQNNSLRDIRDAINNSNAGVNASIVNLGDGEARLLISGNETGEGSYVKISVIDADPADALNKLAFDPDALDDSYAYTFDPDTGRYTPTDSNSNGMISNRPQDAELELNGMDIKSATNSLQNTIDGMNIMLQDVGTTRITVGQDRDSLVGALNSFVEKYNESMGLIRDLTKFDPETAEGAILIGDSTLRAISNQLTMSLSQRAQEATGSIKSLMDLGIRTNLQTGQLTLDSLTLERALDRDFEGAISAISEITGNMHSQVREYTIFGGLLDTRTKGLEVDLRSISDERARFEQRMQGEEARMARQFAYMDNMVGSMQSTSEYLAQQFDMMSSIYKKK